MLERPENVKLFESARVIVGCSSENADKVYFNADDAIENIGQHEYVAFFNGSGDKIGEVKVEHWQDDEYRVALEY
jgi:hypothetical protein